jgi:hypothetical protein
MRRPFHRRVTRVLASGVLACLVIAPTAVAKEAMEAWLATPIPADARPGDTVTLFLTVNQVTAAGSHPLRGSEVFFRLYGPSGDVSEASGTEMRTRGTYEVRITVPDGGAARAEFGVHGTRVDANGIASASDLVWPYDGVLVGAKVPPAVDPDAGAAARPDPAAAATTRPAATAPTAAAGSTAAATSRSVAIALDLRLAAAAIGGLALAAFVLVARRRLRHTTA